LKPDISPDWRWRNPMKRMILAAMTVLSLGIGVANAQAVVSNVPTAHTSGAASTNGRSSQAPSSVQRENPTGLPSYEMRPDGLMINGLLPAQGWEG
jgi:hypothetical protein